MSYKIQFFKGEPIVINDEQGQKLGRAWLNKVSAVEINGSLIATSGISAILKIEDEPDIPKLTLPPRVYTSEKQKIIHEALDNTRAELNAKLGWKNNRDKFGDLITSLNVEN